MIKDRSICLKEYYQYDEFYVAMIDVDSTLLHHEYEFYYKLYKDILKRRENILSDDCSLETIDFDMQEKLTRINILSYVKNHKKDIERFKDLKYHDPKIQKVKLLFKDIKS